MPLPRQLQCLPFASIGPRHCAGLRDKAIGIQREGDLGAFSACAAGYFQGKWIGGGSFQGRVQKDGVRIPGQLGEITQHLVAVHVRVAQHARDGKYAQQSDR